MKRIIRAIEHLFLFKTYTIFDRWFEIALGIMAWINILIITYSLYIVIR